MAEVKYKEILHVFCSRNKLQLPSYTCEDEEGSFYCELRVEGIEFIGCGEAKNKKEAQVIAARAFCEYLVAQKRLQPSELNPSRLAPPHEPLPCLPPQHTPAPLFAGPPHLGTPNRPQHYAVSMVHPGQAGSSRQFSHSSPVQPSSSAAADNGNWTVENAKGRLFLFLQQTRQPRDMSICPAGPDNNRSFVAEMTVYVPKLRRTIYAKEHAGTKKQASNGLALQLVSQLYHLGIIEAHRAPGEKKKINQVTMVTVFSCKNF